MGYQKGQSGNPGGKKSPARMALDALLTEVWTPTERRASMKHLVGLTMHDDPDIALRATQLLMAYAYGKPVERKDVTISTDNWIFDPTEADAPAADGAAGGVPAE